MTKDQINIRNCRNPNKNLSEISWGWGIGNITNETKVSCSTNFIHGRARGLKLIIGTLHHSATQAHANLPIKSIFTFQRVQ